MSVKVTRIWLKGVTIFLLVSVFFFFFLIWNVKRGLFTKAKNKAPITKLVWNVSISYYDIHFKNQQCATFPPYFAVSFLSLLFCFWYECTNLCKKEKMIFIDGKFYWNWCKKRGHFFFFSISGQTRNEKCIVGAVTCRKQSHCTLEIFYLFLWRKRIFWVDVLT